MLFSSQAQNRIYEGKKSEEGLLEIVDCNREHWTHRESGRDISKKKKSKREESKYKRNTTSTKENVPSKIEVQARENTIKAGKKCRTETQCVDYARLYGSSVSKIAVFA